MNSQEHQLVRDIYTIDSSTAAAEEMLDRMVPLLGARHAVMSFYNLIEGNQWAVGSLAFRDWKEQKTEQWTQHHETYVDVLQASARKTAVLGVEQFFSPDELFTEDADKIRCESWLADAEKNLGYSSRIGGAFSVNSTVAGFLGLSFSNNSRDIMNVARSSKAFWLMHLTAASALHQRFRHAERVEAILDRLSLGVMVLDAKGNVAYMNKSAEAIVSSQPQIAVRAGKLHAPSRLMEGIKDCRIENRAAPAKRTLGTALSESSGKVDCVVYATAYSDQKNRLYDQTDGTLVFLRAPSDAPERAVATASKIYHLTSAEEECLGLLVRGASGVEISEIREVSPETVKSQIAQIRMKLQCNKMSELVTNVMLLDMPISDDDE